jgi:hypothetical protein
LKKDREHNGSNKKDRMPNKELQNITQKTKHRAAQTPLISYEAFTKNKQKTKKQCNEKNATCFRFYIYYT